MSNLDQFAEEAWKDEAERVLQQEQEQYEAFVKDKDLEEPLPVTRRRVRDRRDARTRRNSMGSKSREPSLSSNSDKTEQASAQTNNFLKSEGNKSSIEKRGAAKQRYPARTQTSKFLKSDASYQKRAAAKQRYPERTHTNKFLKSEGNKSSYQKHGSPKQRYPEKTQTKVQSDGSMSFQAEEDIAGQRSLDEIPFADALPHRNEETDATVFLRTSQGRVERQGRDQEQDWHAEANYMPYPGVQRIGLVSDSFSDSLTRSIGIFAPESEGSQEDLQGRESIVALALAELVDDPILATKIDMEQTDEMRQLRKEYEDMNQRYSDLQRKTTRRQLYIFIIIIVLVIIGAVGLVNIVTGIISPSASSSSATSQNVEDPGPTSPSTTPSVNPAPTPIPTVYFYPLPTTTTTTPSSEPTGTPWPTTASWPFPPPIMWPSSPIAFPSPTTPSVSPAPTFIAQPVTWTPTSTPWPTTNSLPFPSFPIAQPVTWNPTTTPSPTTNSLPFPSFPIAQPVTWTPTTPWPTSNALPPPSAISLPSSPIMLPTPTITQGPVPLPAPSQRTAVPISAPTTAIPTLSTMAPTTPTTTKTSDEGLIVGVSISSVAFLLAAVLGVVLCRSRLHSKELIAGLEESKEKFRRQQGPTKALANDFQPK